MNYKVIFKTSAIHFLEKADNSVRKRLYAWIKKNLENCDDPTSKGTLLKGEWGGLWRYRVGDYRLVAAIDKKEVIILIIKIGHRKDVYDK